VESYFLRPGNKEQAQKALNAVTGMIKNSKNIRLCVAYFTNDEIADSLIARLDAKRPTQVILNLADILRPETAESSEIKVSDALVKIFESLNGRSYQDQQFLQFKILGRDVKDTSHMHHKFIIGDGTVGFGSLNFTYYAFNYNYENFCFLKDPPVVRAYLQEFDELWNAAEEMVTKGNKIRSITCPNCKKAEGVDIESWGAACLYCGHKFKKTGYDR